MAKLVKNAVKYPAVDFRDATGPKKRRTIKRLFKYFLIAKNRFTSAAAGRMLRFHFSNHTDFNAQRKAREADHRGKDSPLFLAKHDLSVGGLILSVWGQVVVFGDE